ncbi:MAG TPA: TonB family protein [Polyangiaceae bacterium]|jgi:TonB family protein
MCHRLRIGEVGRALALCGASLLGAGAVTAVSGDAYGQPPPEHVVRPPTVISHVDAVYPPSALAAREHADVVLTVTVDADGHVSKVDVAKSSGHGDLDEAAIVAVRQWTFTPAMRDDKPFPARITVPFHFAPPAPPPEVIETSKPDVLPSQPAVPTAPATSPPRAPATPTTPAVGPTAATPGADEVEEIDVHGRLVRRKLGVADNDVTIGALEAVPRTNASDALKLAPGFLLTNEGGSGHAEQVFLRGFDAHEGQDLEFSVDGVPINDSGNYHGNGYADTHFIIPELIHSVRVLEGPYAPQQGNFAVAGSADYQLGLDQRGLTASYSVGNFGTQRMLVLYGPSDAPSGTFAGAEYYTTNGFGTNRQAKRGTAIGQWETPLGKRGTLRVNATAYATEFNNAGVVRNDDYEAGIVGFYGTEDPNQTGNTASRASLALTYEGRFKDIEVSQQLFVIDRTMRLRENWTGFLLDVQEPTQEPHPQRGDLIDFHFDSATFGGRGFARWHGEALGLRQEFEGGYFARVDQTTSTQDRIAAGNNDPYLRDADYTATLGDVGVYVDGNVHFLPWLAARGGVRADMFMFDVLNNCAIQSVDDPSPTMAAAQINQSCLSQLEHGAYVEPFLRTATSSGAIMPRGTLVAGPFDHFEFSASAGNGVRSVDPSYISQGIGTPFVSVESRDLGVSYNGELGHTMLIDEGGGRRHFWNGGIHDATEITVKSEFFQTHVGQDLIFDPTQGRNTLSSGSTRTGWSGAARALGSFFDVAVNATVVKAVFDATGQCSPYCGLLVPYVPDLVLRGDAALYSDMPWRLAHKPVRATIGYGISYVGQRPLPYGQLSDVIFISDASLGFGWTIWNLRLSGQNIFDSKYKLGEYNYASNFQKYLPAPTLAPERSFTAGAPRAVMLTLSATLGGGT